MNTEMDKDILAAFVDGELSPEEAAAVVLHLAKHPADQAYVDDLFAANEALQQTFSAPMYAPLSEGLRKAVFVSDGPSEGLQREPRGRMGFAFGGLALAASVALALGFLPNLSADPNAAGLALGALPASGLISEVLDTRPSGDDLQLADGRVAMVLASFELPDGRFCREFEVIDHAAGQIEIALACRAASGWTVEAMIAEMADQQGETGFVPAGSAETGSLTAYLSRLGAPKALNPEAETSAIALRWGRRQ